MNNWKIAPANEHLAQFVDCYWLIEKTDKDVGIDFPKLNPDPAGHIILTESTQDYRRQPDNFVFKTDGHHLLLPSTQTYILDHHKPFWLLGIKLKVGALYKLALPTNKPCINQVVSINFAELINNKCFCAKTTLEQSGGNANKVRQALDTALTPWLSNIVIDKHSQLVDKVFARLPNIALAELGVSLGCSQRTIERAFLRVTGVTLKQYLSMIKLEDLLEYLYTLESNRINWADIAAEFDFSDQPHLVRYLKSTLGDTPGQYAKKRDLTIDAYGNFE